MENININAQNESFLSKRRREFRYFEGIRPESSKKIDSATRVFYDRLSSLQSTYGAKEASLFENAINYLNQDFYLTYDEKLIFLIRLIDPTLKLLSFYQNLLEDNKIGLDSTPIVKGNVLFSLTKESEDKLADYSYSQFGFYEPLFIKYEAIYKKKLVREETFDKTTNLRMNYTKYITRSLNLNDISLSVNCEEIDEIISEANEYLKQYPNPNLNDLMFQLLHESGTLDYNKVRTKLIFIIFVLDKDLRYKQVYDANYNLVTIRNIISNMFGCYYQFLMELENKFIKDNFETPDDRAQIKKPNYC